MAAKRRGKGEGSVYPVCSRKGPGHDDGDHKGCQIDCWIGQLPNGFYDNGRRKFVRFKRKTQSDVITAMREARRHDVIPDRNTTVKVWLEWWLENGQGDDTAESTVETYRVACRNWIIPNVGRHRLCDLEPDHVRQMLRSLKAKGLSAATRSQARRVLGRALKVAAADGKVTRNVVSLTDGPKQNKKAKTDDVYSRPQCLHLLAVAVERTDEFPNGDPFEAAAVLDVRVAFRISEVRGLDWEAVDWDTHEIDIREAKGGSVGTVPMLPEVEAALRRRVAHQARERLAAGPLWRGGEPGKTGPVFTSARGDRISIPALRARWHRLCRRADLPHARFHAGRHSAAEIMLEDGIELEIVSAILRHAGLAITADVYNRVSADLKRKALAKVSARDKATALLAELSDDEVAQLLGQLKRASGDA